MALSHFTDKDSIKCRLVNLPKARGDFVPELHGGLTQLCCCRKNSGLGACSGCELCQISYSSLALMFFQQNIVCVF